MDFLIGLCLPRWYLVLGSKTSSLFSAPLQQIWFPLLTGLWLQGTSGLALISYSRRFVYQVPQTSCSKQLSFSIRVETFEQQSINSFRVHHSRFSALCCSPKVVTKWSNAQSGVMRPSNTAGCCVGSKLLNRSSTLTWPNPCLSIA